MKLTDKLFSKEMLLLTIIGLAGFTAVMALELNYFFSIILFMCVPSLFLRWFLIRDGYRDNDIILFSLTFLLFLTPTLPMSMMSGLKPRYESPLKK